MDLNDLGYTYKWMQYGLINEDILEQQFIEFEKGEDQNTEHYRYGSFLNWLRQKGSLSDLEIDHYIELALDDPDQLMSGSAVRELFLSKQITENQFLYIKKRLPEFGDWTTKLIRQQELIRRLHNEPLSKEVIEEVLHFSKEYKYNYLLQLIIEIADKEEFLLPFMQNDFGRKIRNQAKERLRELHRSSRVK